MHFEGIDRDLSDKNSKFGPRQSFGWTLKMGVGDWSMVDLWKIFSWCLRGEMVYDGRWLFTRELGDM